MCPSRQIVPGSVSKAKLVTPAYCGRLICLFILCGAAFAGTPNSITPTGSTTTPVGTATLVSFIVRDAANNPLSGVLVTFSAPGSGASGVFNNGTHSINNSSDSSGTVSAAITANSIPGPYSVSGATLTPSGIVSGTFSVANIGPPAIITAFSASTPQSAIIESLFQFPLAVTVQDAAGDALTGVSVKFSAPQTGASGTFGTISGSNTVTKTADGGILGGVILVANLTAGSYTVDASVSTPTGVITASFSLTNLGVGSMTVLPLSTPQVAPIGDYFSTPLGVKLLATNNQPIVGVRVAFISPTSGASATFGGSGVTDIEPFSDANGIAVVATDYFANAVPGTYAITASFFDGITTATASFALRNSGPAVSIALAPGSSTQTTLVNTQFPSPLDFQLKDAANGVATAANVTLAAPLTGPSGQFGGGLPVVTFGPIFGASIPFTANNLSGGPYMVTVTSGAANAAFELTNQGIPTSIVPSPGTTPQSAAIGGSFANGVAVVVKDQGGFGLPGAIVTFTAPSSGPSGTFATSALTAQVTTDANGIAAVPFKANLTVGGPYTVTASTPATGGGLLSSTFSLTNSAQCGGIDPQGLVNQALGITALTDDLNGDGVVSVVDIQNDIKAAIQLGCTLRGMTTGLGAFTSTVRRITEPVSSQVLSVMLAETGPPTIAAVVNAAGLQNGPISPGEVVTLSGTGLGPVRPAALMLDGTGKAATALEGVRVLFDETPAPLTYVSATQINCVVPLEIQGTRSLHVEVSYRGLTSKAFPLTSALSDPALFTADSSGGGPAAALNQDQTYNSATNPAVRGSSVVFFLTGAGRTSPPGVTGSITAILDERPPQPVLPVSVLIGGQPSSVVLFGEAPGAIAGVMRLAVRIPSNAPSGNVPVLASVGGKNSQSSVTVYVQ